MRILLVYDHLDVGGTQTYGRLLSREFTRAGHRVGVASRSGNTEVQFAAAGAEILYWPAPRRTEAGRILRALAQARTLIHNWSPDIIHAHAALPGLLFSYAARRSSRARLPVIFGPQRSWRTLCDFPGGRLVSRLLYALVRMGADEVIAVSEGLYREFAACGIPEARLHLIPNGIDLDRFDQIVADTARPQVYSMPIVGTIGRLVEQKGLDVFIAAAAQVAGQRSDVEFQIAGEGPLRESLAQQIAAQGLTDRIHLLGNRSDVPDLLRQFAVFVSSSRWEGMPYALLEALAAQRPVVATQVLGSEELIQDGVTGLLVPPADPTALSSAILKLLDDRTLAHRLAEAGRDLVEREYNQSAMARQIMQLYQQASARQTT
jgi:glycosyltransferase involved in cell wall biosynthesis